MFRNVDASGGFVGIGDARSMPIQSIGQFLASFTYVLYVAMWISTGQ
jgi:hypothetical protein